MLQESVLGGFSRSNIYNMRQLYIKYPIFQSVTGKYSLGKKLVLWIQKDIYNDELNRDAVKEFDRSFGRKTK